MAVQLMQLANIKVDKKSQRWMSISTLYYTKGNTWTMQVFSYCIEGRNKPLYFSHFLELLPTLGRCLFAERSSPKKQGFEAEE